MQNKEHTYLNVEECSELLIQYGTDRYGKEHLPLPLLVTILDVQTRNCPDYPPVTTSTAYAKHKSKVDYPKENVVPWRGEKRL